MGENGSLEVICTAVIISAFISNTIRRKVRSHTIQIRDAHLYAHPIRVANSVLGKYGILHDTKQFQEELRKRCGWKN